MGGIYLVLKSSMLGSKCEITQCGKKKNNHSAIGHFQNTAHKSYKTRTGSVHFKLIEFRGLCCIFKMPDRGVVVLFLQWTISRIDLNTYIVSDGLKC